MYPRVFLETFWALELRPQVFVAMDFHPDYDERWAKVIQPAIEGVFIGLTPLKAHRVNLSKSGDSIITEILDGITHSQLVLADVSTTATDKKTGRALRNSNVLFEVGVALACRQSCEVLLVRDDRDPFLFDVSVIPHVSVDFTDQLAAIALLQKLLNERLDERKLINDARVRKSLLSLSSDEIEILKSVVRSSEIWGTSSGGSVDFRAMSAIPRLLDKNILVWRGQFSDGTAAYSLSPLGREVARFAVSGGTNFGEGIKLDPPAKIT